MSSRKNEIDLYPYHADDGGAWLPTTDHGLVCSKCHEVMANPPVLLLNQSHKAHRAAGGAPVNVARKLRRAADLLDSERRALVAIGKGRGNGESVRPIVGNSLAALGLCAQEQPTEYSRPVQRSLTERGRAMFDAIEAAKANKPKTVPLFDLGPPQTSRKHIAPHLRNVGDGS